MTDPVSQREAPEPEGLALTRSFETFRAAVYDDARPNHVLQPGDRPLGTLTIGYGHTGPDVTVGMAPWTETQAETALEGDSEAAYDAVDRTVTVALSPGQRAALGDFTFNAGIDAFMQSTLLKVLNAGAYEQVPAQLERWVDVRGAPSAGLERRRQAEIALWNGAAPALQPRLFPPQPSARPDPVIDAPLPRPAPGAAPGAPRL